MRDLGRPCTPGPALRGLICQPLLKSQHIRVRANCRMKVRLPGAKASHGKRLKDQHIPEMKTEIRSGSLTLLRNLKRQMSATSRRVKPPNKPIQLSRKIPKRKELFPLNRWITEAQLSAVRKGFTGNSYRLFSRLRIEDFKKRTLNPDDPSCFVTTDRRSICQRTLSPYLTLPFGIP